MPSTNIMVGSNAITLKENYQKKFCMYFLPSGVSGGCVLSFVAHWVLAP